MITEFEKFVIQRADMKHAYGYYQSLFKGACDFLHGVRFALGDQEKVLLNISAKHPEYSIKCTDAPEKARREFVPTSVEMMMGTIILT